MTKPIHKQQKKTVLSYIFLFSHQPCIFQICAKKSENNDSLETQLKDAQYTLTESENKYETLARKLTTMETEAVRSNERAENVECKFIDIEDELKVIILYGLLPSPA